MAKIYNRKIKALYIGQGENKPAQKCLVFTEEEFEALKSEIASEIIADIDNRLHDMAMEYHNAGHPEYFAVCEMVHHKVIRAVENKYKG